MQIPCRDVRLRYSISSGVSTPGLPLFFGKRSDPHFRELRFCFIWRSTAFSCSSLLIFSHLTDIFSPFSWSDGIVSDSLFDTVSTIAMDSELFVIEVVGIDVVSAGSGISVFNSGVSSIQFFWKSSVWSYTISYNYSYIVKVGSVIKIVLLTNQSLLMDSWSSFGVGATMLFRKLSASRHWVRNEWQSINLLAHRPHTSNGRPLSGRIWFILRVFCL